MSFTELLNGILPGGKDSDDGKEQKSDQQVTPEGELATARAGAKTLMEAEEGAVAKLIRKRWDRLEPDARKRQASLKVNFLRYQGHTFAQLHPEDPNRVYLPTGGARTPPTVNKIRRSVHRYQAQVTADEPVMEGVPASHADASRDEAEAATQVLAGEWHRMNLNNELERSVQLAAIMRSAFWFFEFDRTAGGRVKAQKFFTDEKGQRYLGFVDKSGAQVDDETAAAEIWEGNTKLHNLSPMNVRYSGARYAHDATEVMVGRLITLREAYEMDPDLREVKLRDLLCDVPPDAEAWLRDLLGESPKAAPAYDDEDMEKDGNSVEEEDSKLDANVFVLHYFLKRGRRYPRGFHGILVGKHLAFRGDLRYGVIPVAQFKFLEDLSDSLGLSLVDLLKDPQELLDFVNGQILRFLQTLKRRWFLPMHSGVSARDLLNPTRSVIEYNAAAGEPKAEQNGEIPNSLVQWADRFQVQYDDEVGIHDTMQGKHVPGVTSGRHAEALRSGDETLLGLTRTQILAGLLPAGRIILEIAKKEWTRPRRVQYFGAERDYIDVAFEGMDLGDTSGVRLKRGTLLMATPAQRLETLYSFAEMQVLTPADLRRLAPLTDTAGVSLAEDTHYQRARRQNRAFLSGPPDALKQARDDFDRQAEILARQVTQLQSMQTVGAPPEALEPAMARIQDDVLRIEEEWAAELAKFAPSHRIWEDDPAIALIHAEEHMRALSTEKVDRFPEWWVESFEQHAKLEWQLGHPELMAQQAQSATPPGTPAEQPQTLATGQVVAAA